MNRIQTGDKIIYNNQIYYIRNCGTILYLYLTEQNLIAKRNRQKVIPNLITRWESNPIILPNYWDIIREESDEENDN